MTTRKERKHKRKNKSSPPKKAGKLMDLLAREMGKVMSNQRNFDSEDVNKKVYCPTCKLTFCLGFDGIDAFCEDCYIMANKQAIEDSGGIFTGCQKETAGGRICQDCSH